MAASNALWSSASSGAPMTVSAVSPMAHRIAAGIAFAFFARRRCAFAGAIGRQALPAMLLGTGLLRLLATIGSRSRYFDAVAETSRHSSGVGAKDDRVFGKPMSTLNRAIAAAVMTGAITRGEDAPSNICVMSVTVTCRSRR